MGGCKGALDFGAAIFVCFECACLYKRSGPIEKHDPQDRYTHYKYHSNPFMNRKSFSRWILERGAVIQIYVLREDKSFNRLPPCSTSLHRES